MLGRLRTFTPKPLAGVLLVTLVLLLLPSALQAWSQQWEQLAPEVAESCCCHDLQPVLDQAPAEAACCQQEGPDTRYQHDEHADCAEANCKHSCCQSSMQTSSVILYPSPDAFLLLQISSRTPVPLPRDLPPATPHLDGIFRPPLA